MSGEVAFWAQRRLAGSHAYCSRTNPMPMSGGNPLSGRMSNPLLGTWAGLPRFVLALTCDRGPTRSGLTCGQAVSKCGCDRLRLSPVIWQIVQPVRGCPARNRRGATTPINQAFWAKFAWRKSATMIELLSA